MDDTDTGPAIVLARDRGGPGLLAGLAGLTHRRGDTATARALLDNAIVRLCGSDDDRAVLVHEALRAAATANDLRAPDRVQTVVARAEQAGWTSACLLAEAGRWDEAVALASTNVLDLTRVAAVANRRAPPLAAALWDRALDAARRAEGRDRGWRLRDVAVALAAAGDEGRLRQAVREARRCPCRTGWTLERIRLERLARPNWTCCAPVTTRLGLSVVVDLYSGFEGEPEMVFSSSQGSIRTWSGFFDDLMRAISPSESGWAGFALHYHLLTGWREGPSWEDPDPADTLRQLERVEGLEGRAEELRRALIDLYRASMDVRDTVTFREE